MITWIRSRSEPAARRRIARAGARLLVAIAVVSGSVVLAPEAQAAQQLVSKRCNLGPRGDACAYLIYDAATSTFWAKGAVNPKAGHLWRIDTLYLWFCSGDSTNCNLGLEVGPSPDSAQYQSLTTPGLHVTGAVCLYTWRAVMYYVVDRRDLYSVFTDPPYGGRC